MSPNTNHELFLCLPTDNGSKFGHKNIELLICLFFVSELVGVRDLAQTIIFRAQ